MAEIRWATREGPILEAIYQAVESESDPGGAARDATPDITDRQRQEALLALVNDGFIDAIVITTAEDEPTVIPKRLLAKGLRAVEAWPSDDPLGALLALLEERELAEQDPEVRTRLQRFRDALKELGPQLATGLLVNLASRATGGW